MSARVSRRAFLKRSATAGGSILLGGFVTGCATGGVANPARRSLVTARGDAIGESLNLAVNELADVLHRFYLNEVEPLSLGPLWGLKACQPPCQWKVK